MFEKFRETMKQFMAGAPPEERRAMLARMKDTLVQARVGLDEMRDGVEKTRKRLAVDRHELETVQRRKVLATQINDAETIAVATRYEAQMAERVAILERKLEAQEAELAVAEREVGEMTTELKQASLGTAPGAASASPLGASRSEADDSTEPLDDGAPLREELDALARQRRRSAQDEAAEARLAELKRRMGK